MGEPTEDGWSTNRNLVASLQAQTTAKFVASFKQEKIAAHVTG